MACVFAMLPDCVEYGEYIDHERHEGMVYSGSSFGMKLANGLGPVIASTVMQYGGYVNNAETQTDMSMTTILISSTAIPSALFVLGIICMIGYKLDKLYPQIISELQKRKHDSTSINA